MVKLAQVGQIIETGLTAIAPMPDVVTVNKMLVRTAREAASLVSGA